MEYEHPRRRKEDQLQNKILKWAGIIAALGIIGSGVLYVGSKWFMTKQDADIYHADLQKQITIQDKTQAVILNKFENVEKSLARIEYRLYKYDRGNNGNDR